MKLVTVFIIAIATICGAAEGAILPIRIPFDRVYDTQWNPPGHPTLSARSLKTLDKVSVYGITGLDNIWGQTLLDGYYTFETDGYGNIKSFLWVTDEGAIVTIFEDIDPLLISEEVFFFNGNPGANVAGGGFGTLVQGFGVDPGQAGDYAVEPVEESNIAPQQWLSDTFNVETSTAHDLGRSTSLTVLIAGTVAAAIVAIA